VGRGAGELGDDRLLFAGPQLFLGRVELGLHPHPIAEIGEDADGADGLAVLHDQRGREEHGDVGAVDRVDLGPVALEPPRAAVLAGVDQAHDRRRVSGRVDLAHVELADGVPGDEAGDALGGAVEEQDHPGHVGGDDRVDRALDHALEEVLRLGQLRGGGAVGGHVAEAHQDRPALLAQHAAEADAEDAPLPGVAADRDVHHVGELAAREAQADRLQAAALGGIHQQVEDAGGQIFLGAAGDLVRARVGEEHLGFAVDDDDPVGRRVEEVGVVLERLEPPLRLEPGEGDLLRLIAHRLQNAGVAQRDRRGVGDGARQRELVLAERHGVAPAEKEHAEGLLFEDDRQEREGAEPVLGHPGADEIEERVRLHVLDHQGLAVAEHLLNLGVFLQLDRQIEQLFVVARGDDVADPIPVTDEDDAAAIDARDLGDAADDGKEDVAKIERGGERLRQLEDDLGVALLAAEGLHVLAHPQLAADAGDELHRAEGLADEIVGAHLEGLRDVFLGVERRQHHDGQVGRARVAAERAEHREAVGRRHDEVEQHQRRRARREPVHRRRARGGDRRRQPRRAERLRQHMATDGVVVDDEDRGDRGHDR